MVQCVVVGCSNRTPRDSKKGISFHRFPLKDQGQLNKWLAQIKRKNLPPLKNCHICSDHFEPWCFEIDYRQVLLPGKAPKRGSIKDDAIPTKFPHKKNSSQRPASERRKRKAHHEEVSGVWYSYEGGVNTNSIRVRTKETVKTK